VPERESYFTDRRAAGRQLGEALDPLGLDTPLVLALPRGGVPVAFEIAKRLKAPLDILLVRKIGSPGWEEVGIGALADFGGKQQLVIDEDYARMTGADAAYIEREVAQERAEIERRRAAYGQGAGEEVRGRTVILVDDGIATGGTVKAAVKALRAAEAGRIVLAVPVAPPSVLAELEDQCDEVVCLSAPQNFSAVGVHYADFEQTSDAEVIGLLEQAGREV
jgi:predicted phosphoribosyltransferase